MSIFRSAIKPEDVFTPRSPAVNEDMYVNRDDLERSLKNALKGTKNIIVTGESGSGKTWLYKNVFSEEKVFHLTVNLANAALKGGLDEALRDKIDRLGDEVKVEHNVGGSVKAAPMGIGPEKSGSFKSEIGQQSSFERLVRHIREEAGQQSVAILVYENLEQVIEDRDILKAIASTIVLLDDEDISKYNVKICIVGVPTDLRQLLMRASKNITTLSNRTLEIPEVARLSEVEAIKLMRRGFEEKLKYSFECDSDFFYRTACWKTDRIAQHVHEYCLTIAQHASDNGNVVSSEIISIAEQEWLTQSLGFDYTAVEARMNSRDTKAGRRNQILFCIGNCQTEDFKSTDIEKMVREVFHAKGVALNIVGNLSELASGDKPLIRRTPKGDAFRFTSPKYRMCLRTMLIRTDDNKVKKR